ncbi:unnamed protein product [Cylicocyclus nassatus]|uniref:Uncharacterized protein n=1 Tax=Cylicocyclus nassatus TaxID=53992 RepID=A0AA36H6S8_CYLNA|nr:unnamed protein product [Cylicocyclus nassatus]
MHSLLLTYILLNLAVPVATSPIGTSENKNVFNEIRDEYNVNKKCAEEDDPHIGRHDIVDTVDRGFSPYFPRIGILKLMKEKLEY